MIWIFSDYLSRAGGIETYLGALCGKLESENIPFRVAVCEMEPCPIVDAIEARGISVHRQKRLPGDRWAVRQHALRLWVIKHLGEGDWLFCIRQPKEEIFEQLVDGVHSRGAKIAASWMFTPDALTPKPKFFDSFKRAVSKADLVISVSQTGVPMYKEEYSYDGEIEVVPYHNELFFEDALPMPESPPWRFGFMGRIDNHQKNLDAIIEGFSTLSHQRNDVCFEIHGDGPDRGMLETLAHGLARPGSIQFRGPYDHRRDLKSVLSPLHCVLYVSKFEGGPCFSLLEAMQAGRFVLASAVGGIPDLYQEHPEAGMLLQSIDSKSVYSGMTDVLLKLESGEISTSAPRRRYDEAFSMRHAHSAWIKALNLD